MKYFRLIVLMVAGLVMSSFCPPDDESYMKIYVQYIMQNEVLSPMEAFYSYTLVYIDDDDIPEMVLHDYGEDENGNEEMLCVLTQHEGEVTEMFVSGMTLYFFEKSGLLSGGQHCNWGDCTENIFQLKDGGFEQTAAWHSVLMWDASSDENDPDIYYLYYFNDEEVDEATAERLLNEAFSSEGKFVSTDECEWFNKEELIKKYQ